MSIKRSAAVPALSLGMALVILYFDTRHLPLGHSIAPLYFAPVLVSLLDRRPWVPIAAALLATLLLALGFVFSPPGNAEASMINRISASTMLCIAAGVVAQVMVLRNRERDEAWRKARLIELGVILRPGEGLADLCNRALGFLADTTGAQVGALYLADDADDDRLLVRTATFAFPPGDPGARPEYRFGSGLIGQAAVDGETRTLRQVPEGYLSVHSALGRTAPREILCVPFTADDETQAVLELAFLTPPPPQVTTLLEQSRPLVANAIRAAQQRRRTNELLARTRQQAERLQEQQHEMSTLNEELEQQNTSLLATRTQLEQQASELEQINRELEEQRDEVSRRNQLLSAAERSLQEQKAEIERASQYKSAFLANMSHELRTPLNSALILSRLLADNRAGNLTEEQVRFAQTIHDSGNDLLELINDVLDLSKVEAGKLDLRIVPFETRALIERLNRSFSPVAQGKGIELRTEIDPGVPDRITSDPHRLEQVLNNLLSNAIKFTAAGHVRLALARHDRELVFSVRDTGIGIAAEQQRTIFEAFEQGDAGVNRQYGGSGLGLTIARQLTGLLGGSISLASEPGAGATFSVSLPLERVPPERVPPEREVDPPDSRHAAGTTESPAPAPPENAGADDKDAIPTFSFEDDRAGSASRERLVLIIEDDEAFARILYDLAHEMNFSAFVTPSAQEGMALARDFQPSAILLDIRLPDQNGLIVLERLKDDPRTRHIPVHVVSVEDFTLPARRLGAARAMLKPVKRAELEQAFGEVADHLQGKLKRVLLVEDDAAQRESITQLVAGQDVQIDAVATATEALDRLRSLTFDCLIIDLGLADMSGEQVLAELARSDSPYAYPPVIVYTGRDLNTGEENLLRRYASSIVIKSARSPERLLNEVTLFLHRVESELPPERQRMLRELRSRELTLDGTRILVVDDDVRNVFALTSALEPHGASTLIARNGNEALAVLDGTPDIDLVLMDIMMPGMDGCEAIRAIRAQERFRLLPIIAVTAKATHRDELQCLEAGANDYLAKPVQMDKLISLVRVWLSSPRWN